MVNTNMHVFKHPKYYEEFRKRSKRHQKELKASLEKKTISPDPATAEEGRASSVKPQAPEASSGKRQAPSSKRQA